MESLLGEKVKGKEGEVNVSSFEKEGGVVGLYFSAHWCPPCRGFTPVLKKWYEGIKAGPNKDKFEMVFLSSDRDEKKFDEYYDEMPWLAVPYANREKKVKKNGLRQAAATKLETACIQITDVYRLQVYTGLHGLTIW